MNSNENKEKKIELPETEAIKSPRLGVPETEVIKFSPLAESEIEKTFSIDEGTIRLSERSKVEKTHGDKLPAWKVWSIRSAIYAIIILLVLIVFGVPTMIFRSFENMFKHDPPLVPPSSSNNKKIDPKIN